MVTRILRIVIGMARTVASIVRIVIGRLRRVTGINMDGINEWRAKYRLSPISNPHISCCHLRKEVFDQILVSIVYQETGKWDRYLVFVKGGGCREIKNGKQRFEVENEKKEKKDEKKKERKDEKKEKRESDYWDPPAGWSV